MNEPLESAQRTRQSLLEQIAAISTMQPGSLTEEYRERPALGGEGVVRLGPYFKYQHWRDGRNCSRRVPADEAEQLREDTANAKQFNQLTTELAQLNIDQTLALRDAEATARDEAKEVKKNSVNKPFSKGSAKRSASSTKLQRD